MGVWIGALLSYSRILAPRASRIFILGQAVAGFGLLLDELFLVLYRARTGEGAMLTAIGRPTVQEAVQPAGREARTPEGTARAA